MSHAATNWALKQKGLKPATKIVLLCLADCHNPHMGCFPSHKTLAADAEMSERSVRDHLELLEAKGLIRRVAGERRGGEFAATNYQFAFEFDGRQDLPTAEIANGENASPPTANSANHRRQNLPTNLVRVNPVRETGKEDAREIAGLLEIYASPEAVASFMAYRKRSKGKALTLTAAKRLANNLRAIVERGGNPDDALGMAEERVWLTVEPDWYFNAKGKQHGNGSRGVSEDPTLRAIFAAAGAFKA